MDKHELEARTKMFAIGVIRFVGEFNQSSAGRVIGQQLLKSGTSIGANYREANRAVSRRDFAHKISITEKEASETQYWLEICLETNIGKPKSCRDLLAESQELLAIFTSIGRSLRSSDQVSSGPQTAYGGGAIAIDVAMLVPSSWDSEDA
jgi:four helix bundle protein